MADPNSRADPGTATDAASDAASAPAPGAVTDAVTDAAPDAVTVVVTDAVLGVVTDWDAAGLTAGLTGHRREARIALLDELAAAGVPVQELRRAVAEDRLVLLPVERELAGRPGLTRAELAEHAGVDADLAARLLAALGLSLPEPDVPAYSEQDLDLALALRSVLDAGLPPETVVELARVLGLGMARYAEAVRTAIGRGFIRQGDSEYDVATRYAAVARGLLPEAGALLRHAFTQHLLQLVRSDVITAAELERGEVAGHTVQAVAFADLVGFTWLGEHLESEELGAVAARLAELTDAALEPPCRLVKTIGDAVMLVSTDPGALVRSVLRLVAAAEADERLPALRAGIALGPAVARFGDYFGSAVNLASRVTGAARAGTVLATGPVRDELADDAALAWRRAGLHRLKGVGRQPLWRVRPAHPL